MTEALALLFGIALLAATAWCPARLTRVLGALFAAVVIAVVMRFTFGLLVAFGTAALAGVFAFRFLPLLVLRRVMFLVPALRVE